MICQVCDLDKKSSFRRTRIFLVRVKGKRVKTVDNCFHEVLNWNKEREPWGCAEGRRRLYFRKGEPFFAEKQFKSIPAPKVKRRSFDLLFWCGLKDLNLHSLATIRTWILRVCQFRQTRIWSFAPNFTFTAWCCPWRGVCQRLAIARVHKFHSPRLPRCRSHSRCVT